MDTPTTVPTTVTVAVVTYGRPEFVRECLRHVAAQTRRPDQVLVVDASVDDLTRRVVDEARSTLDVTYLRSEAGVGTTATSRAIALRATTSEILAFLDDDAYADQDWLERLLLPYADVAVAAVGGRARNGQPGEESEGVDCIGRLLPNGRLTGHFAADPGHDVDVDHLLGANMSVRTAVLRHLGGIHDYYPGTCLREESDPCLRIGAAGYRLVYTPAAAVTHVAAPYPRGRRFDLRYHYFGHRNHVVLLVRTLGPGDRRIRRYVAATLRDDVAVGVGRGIRALLDPRLSPRARLRRAANQALRSFIAAVALGTGMSAAWRAQRRDGRPSHGSVLGR